MNMERNQSAEATAFTGGDRAESTALRQATDTQQGAAGSPFAGDLSRTGTFATALGQGMERLLAVGDQRFAPEQMAAFIGNYMNRIGDCANVMQQHVANISTELGRQTTNLNMSDAGPQKRAAG